MTVPSEVNRSGPYIGNGVTTVFPYEFRILDQAHIKVVRTENGAETTLTLGADYTVSGVGDDAGGSVTTSVAPTSAQTITNLRDVPFTQETDLENQGAYFAETVEASFDLAAMRDQQLKGGFDRSLRVSESSSFLGMTVPDPAAGKYLKWKQDLTGLENSGEVTLPPNSYMVATQTEAEGGAVNTALMTPLRTQQQMIARSADLLAAMRGIDGKNLRIAAQPARGQICRLADLSGWAVNGPDCAPAWNDAMSHATYGDVFVSPTGAPSERISYFNSKPALLVDGCTLRGEAEAASSVWLRNYAVTGTNTDEIFIELGLNECSIRSMLVYLAANQSDGTAIGITATAAAPIFNTRIEDCQVYAPGGVGHYWRNGCIINGFNRVIAPQGARAVVINGLTVSTAYNAGLQILAGQSVSCNNINIVDVNAAGFAVAGVYIGGNHAPVPNNDSRSIEVRGNQLANVRIENAQSVIVDGIVGAKAGQAVLFGPNAANCVVRSPVENGTTAFDATSVQCMSELGRTLNSNYNIKFLQNVLHNGITFFGKDTVDQVTSGGYISNSTTLGSTFLNTKTASGATSTISHWYSGSYKGGLTFNDTATSVDTGSDGRLKPEDKRTLLQEAIDVEQIVRELKALRFWWSDSEQWDHGFIAQDAHRIYPRMIPTVGDDNPDLLPGDEGYRPWGRNDTALVPVIWAMLQILQGDRDEIKARVEKLEAG
ncbi:hypothetical protein RX327_24280 [Bradyrhizobium sp. BEA-2-5]|uniref:hypothetical protein n=1 Tax=Bradyrhizobium sp. BEA-2-5 TaxID=3080015 RepID=UPI00293E572A|nr:hypothetical protein [Bradyrhizobium sp. BEA-2-5]WOH79022.1 hypothetical protein RX327_24280 [Bradyrhizobium sp. BEA-2-5]